MQWARATTAPDVDDNFSGIRIVGAMLGGLAL